MKKGERTRFHLLECATEVIARHGSSHLTVRLLAEHAGVSPSLVAKYFPKAEDIYPEVIRYCFDQYFKDVPPDLKTLRGNARLIASAKFAFEFFVFDHMNYNMCITHAYIYARGNREVGKILYDAVWGSVGRMEAHVRDLLEDKGKTATDREVTLFAHAYMQLLEGALLHCTLLKNKKEIRDFSEMYFESLQSRIDEFLGPRLAI